MSLRFITPLGGSFSNTKTLKLDGANKYVDFGNNYDVSTKAQLFSASGWWYPTGGTNFQGLLDKQNPLSPFQGHTMLWVTGGAAKLRFQLGSITPKLYDASTTAVFNLNTWHFLAYAWNGTLVTIYVDSTVPQVLTTISNNLDTASCSTTQPLRLGYSQSNAVKFAGNLNQWTFWNNYTLTTNDVTTLYNLGHPGDLAGVSTISSWWELNQLDTPSRITDRKDSINGTGVSLVAADFVTTNPTPP